MEAQDQDSGGSLSSGKDRFYFDSYLKSKLKIQNDIKLNKDMAAKFSNSIKIRIESEKFIESKNVFLAIKELIGTSVKNIITMMQYKSNKVWIIQFNKEFNIEDIIGNEIQINNTKSTIQNACSPENRDVYLIGVLRIHWFPTNLEHNEVVKHLKKGIKNVEIITKEIEYYKDPEQKHMSNGIIRLKIKYSIDDHYSVLALLGINEIAENRTLIQLAGHPPKCLFCSQFGHKVSDCESKKLFCTKCRKNGHLVSNCTLAKQISLPKKVDIEEVQYNDQNIDLNNIAISTEKKAGEHNKLKEDEYIDNLVKKNDDKIDKSSKRNRSLNADENSNQKKEKINVSDSENSDLSGSGSSSTSDSESENDAEKCKKNDRSLDVMAYDLENGIGLNTNGNDSN